MIDKNGFFLESGLFWIVSFFERDYPDRNG